MSVLLYTILAAFLPQAVLTYWMEDIPHKGKASFNPDPNYQVFRNVKDFGAKGDGVTDDSAAINAAISSGNRCSFDGVCAGTTTTPATVYFPAGTYLVSSSILDFYYTQLIGDPVEMPTIKGSANFTTFGGTSTIIDADRYSGTGKLAYGPTNVFFRQIRNLVLDTTDLSGTVHALHWPSSQATTIQNVVFLLSEAPDNMHTGIFMESGSGGFLADLIFHGGRYGAQFGNQQYTARNLTFYQCQTAILQLWDWFWVYKDIAVVNCNVGIDMASTSVGSAILIDSFFQNVSAAVVNGRSIDSPGNLPGQGTLVLKNVVFSNVDLIIKGIDGSLLVAQDFDSAYVSGTILGNVYVPNGPRFAFDGPNDWFPSLSALEDNGRSYERSKPQYENTPAGLFISPRTFGARADGLTDDTAALLTFFRFVSRYFRQGVVGFVDAGFYKVTDTIYIPPDVRIVGEALSSVIMGSGPKFSDMKNPRPVVQIGKPGQSGYIEWSDMIVSTQGATSGAILIEYNLAGCSGCQEASGMWDVHIRVGGFAGSLLQIADCPTTPHQENVMYRNCMAAYLGMHITALANNLYIENHWFWVADHDIEDIDNSQISVYGGRGLLIESELGRIWTVASGVEHWTLYQYQLVKTRDIWMGHIQTETPYYQPNPPAPYPFDTIDTELNDPDFSAACANLDHGHIPGSEITAPCEMAWGLRMVDSRNVLIYGSGHYSFFNNYNTTCSNGPGGSQIKCQSRIVWIEDSSSSGATANVFIYDLNTIGTISMVTDNSEDVALWHDNWNVFGESFPMFKT